MKHFFKHLEMGFGTIVQIFNDVQTGKYSFSDLRQDAILFFQNPT